MDVALPNSSALTGSVLQTLLCVTVEMIAETPLTRSTVVRLSKFPAIVLYVARTHCDLWIFHGRLGT